MTDEQIEILKIMVKTGHVYYYFIGGGAKRVVKVGEADDTGTGMEPAAILDNGEWCALWASELGDFDFVISQPLTMDIDSLLAKVKLAMSADCEGRGRCASHKVNEDYCNSCRPKYEAIEQLRRIGNGLGE